MQARGGWNCRRPASSDGKRCTSLEQLGSCSCQSEADDKYCGALDFSGNQRGSDVVGGNRF